MTQRVHFREETGGNMSLIMNSVVLSFYQQCPTSLETNIQAYIPNR